MKGKRYSDEQIIGILKAHAAGAKVADLVREHGISEQSFYRRKSSTVAWLYTELCMHVWTKRRKKLVRPQIPMAVPTRPNEHWPMDFVSDQLACGRRPVHHRRLA